MPKTAAERAKIYRAKKREEPEKWDEHKKAHARNQKAHRERKEELMTDQDREKMREYEKQRKREQRAKKAKLKVSLFKGLSVIVL